MSTTGPGPESSRSGAARQGRYLMVERVGSGGFGEVWRADLIGEAGFRKSVAIKILSEVAQQDPQLAGRLRDEARILALLRHRAIVGVDDLVRIDGRWAVVMEYVEGQDLSKLLVDGPMPIRAAVELAREVALALAAAHNARHPDTGELLRIIHRDIKPANIMVGPGGEVKVLDFGVARARFAAREADTRAFHFGSPGYVSPERYDGDDRAASDVWGLGVMLYEALSGRRLGRVLLGEGPYGMQLHDAFAALPDTLDEPLRALLRDALAYEPEERPTAAVLASRLREVLVTAPGEWLNEWAPQAVQVARGALPTEPNSSETIDLDRLMGEEIISAGWGSQDFLDTPILVAEVDDVEAPAPPLFPPPPIVDPLALEAPEPPRLARAEPDLDETVQDVTFKELVPQRPARPDPSLDETVMDGAFGNSELDETVLDADLSDLQPAALAAEEPAALAEEEPPPPAEVAAPPPPAEVAPRPPAAELAPPEPSPLPLHGDALRAEPEFSLSGIRNAPIFDEPAAEVDWPPRRSRPWLAIGAAVVVLGLAAAWGWSAFGPPEERLDDPLVTAPAEPEAAEPAEPPVEPEPVGAASTDAEPTAPEPAEPAVADVAPPEPAAPAPTEEPTRAPIDDPVRAPPPEPVTAPPPEAASAPVVAPEPPPTEPPVSAPPPSETSTGSASSTDDALSSAPVDPWGRDVATPPPAATGNVVITGQVDSLRLVGADGASRKAGVVPVGHYRVTWRFGDNPEVKDALSFDVAANQVVTLWCSESSASCRLLGP
ncbi:MAG: protein kinase [Alphaproteobacteria bacterium]|nr:protein kinase [Alphaproteobacteria bacterium]